MVGRNLIGNDTGFGAREPLPNVQQSLVALQECTEKCLTCFSSMAGEVSDNDCPACCMQCSEICMLTMTLLSQDSPLALDLCELCIKACEWCGNQCSAHPHDHCQACAESCRRCVEALQQSLPITATTSLDSREAFGG